MRLRAALAGCVLVLGTVAACGGPDPSPAGDATVAPRGDRAVVERVVDGDTIVVDGTRVRLIGIDAPESVKPGSPVECFGPEASAALKALLPRRTAVILEYDRERTDRYGRTLAHVWSTQPLTLVNEVLVHDGFATVLTIPPNQRHEAELEAAQSEARAAGRGLWGACR